MREGITFAGSMIVDHVKTVDAFPKEGQLAPIRSVEKSVGGLVCNTAVDFAILDPAVPVYAVGKVGNDGDGERVLGFLREHSIDVSRIEKEGVTSFTDVISTAEQRTFFQYGGACDLFDPDEESVKNLPGKLLHIGYLLLLPKLDAHDPVYGTKMARLLHAAKEAGMETSIDLVSENADRYKDIVPTALPYVDYLILNEIEAGKTLGLSLREGERLLPDRVKEALRRLMALGKMKWIVIHCPEGAYGLDKDGNECFSPAAPLPSGYIAGKVGAGDAFCAGTLLAAYRGRSLAEALICGNAAAQVSLRAPTSTGSMVSMKEALAEYRRYAEAKQE